MRERRTYGAGCAAAHALDLVGERWALLVVRELLLGPKRFADLQAGMPGVSPNVLAQRLHELRASGVVRRRRLGPPASTWVYELTEWGSELEPVLVSLGRWGSRSPAFDATARLSPDSAMLSLRALFDPRAFGPLNAVYAVHVGDDSFVVHVADGLLEVGRAVAERADAAITADLETIADVLAKRLPLGTAVSDGRLTLAGEAEAVQRLLDALRMPQPAPLP